MTADFQRRLWGLITAWGKLAEANLNDPEGGDESVGWFDALNHCSAELQRELEREDRGVA